MGSMAKRAFEDRILPPFWFIKSAIRVLLPKVRCRTCWNLSHIGTFQWPPSKISEVFKSAPYCGDCRLLAAVLTPYKGSRFKHSSFRYGFSEYNQVTLTIEVHFGEHNIHPRPYADVRLEVYTSSGSKCPWAPILQKRNISGNTGSDEAFDQLSQWLQSCASSHGCTRNIQSTKLPTRVVELDGPQNVKLKVTNADEFAPYVCLSWRWGSVPVIKTTSDSVSRFQQSIPWGELPETFKEAIEVVHRLGIKYIWIDSLCILQDSAEDWRRESSRMTAVYSQSYLTIAATHALNSTKGCFATADKAHISRTCTVALSHSPHESYAVHVRQPLKHPGNESVHFPLLERAWAFQERLLSPRVLHFGPQEMLWECMECVACECSSWPHKNDEDIFLAKPRLERFGHQHSKPTSAWYGPPVVQIWHQIVEEYSSKLLTKESDVFPALQGIAHRSLSLDRGAYYAGLWERTILEDLLWRCVSPGRRPTKWRAPTWSWASVCGQVLWRYGFQNKSMLTLKWYSSILHASTTPVGTDPLGQLVAGTLKLVGPCVTAYVGPPSRFFFPPKYIKTITLSPQQNERSKKLCWYFWPDDNTIYSKGTPIFAMKMAKRDGRWERGEVNIYYVFLIFKCVDEEAQVYERIGYAKTFCTSRRDKKRLHRLERFLAREEKTMTLTVV